MNLNRTALAVLLLFLLPAFSARAGENPFWAADSRNNFRILLPGGWTVRRHLSPELLKLTQQLFDVLAMAVTRGPLTGIWGSWENASQADIQQFIKRWEHSSLDLLQMGHAALLQLVMLAWYGQAEAWGHCGYPGPPQI